VRVFISYSRIDAKRALDVAEDVEALGHSVWYDRELPGGQPWWDRILEALRGSDVTLFLVSKTSLRSIACQREYRYALRLTKLVVPLLVGEDASEDILPPELRLTQLVDYRAGDKASMRELARALSVIAPAQFASRPLPDPLPEPPDAPVSQLASLIDRVNSRALPLAEQQTLLHEVMALVHSEEDGEAAREVLRALRGRADVVASVARNIDDLLAAADHRAFWLKYLRSWLLWGSVYVLMAWAAGFWVNEMTGDKGVATLVVVVPLVVGAGFLVRRRRRAVGQPAAL
jgi:hypothetical protein